MNDADHQKDPHQEQGRNADRFQGNQSEKQAESWRFFPRMHRGARVETQKDQASENFRPMAAAIFSENIENLIHGAGQASEALRAITRKIARRLMGLHSSCATPGNRRAISRCDFSSSNCVSTKRILLASVFICSQEGGAGTGIGGAD